MGSFVGRMKTSVNWANFPTFIVQVIIVVVGSACFGFSIVVLECWDGVGSMRVMFLSVFWGVDVRSKIVFPSYDNP